MRLSREPAGYMVLGMLATSIYVSMAAVFFLTLRRAPDTLMFLLTGAGAFFILAITVRCVTLCIENRRLRVMYYIREGRQL